MVKKKSKEYIIFDLETTGLSVTQDRIVEFACCIVNNKGQEVDERLELLINPEIPIPERVIKIHGIRNEYVKDKPTFREVTDIIEKKFKNRIAIAYYGLAFDFPFLINEFIRAGKKNFSFYGCIDPKIRVKHTLKNINSFSLINVSNHLQIPVLRPHRAMDDVLLLKNIFKKIYTNKVSLIKNNTYDLFDDVQDYYFG
ncbi:MAG TPA: 3'-5' exonuclease [bacterium]|nr:3'-5' exonuclease [bacterium]HOL47877.1 3'-5' exonuclease [bacterium]HPQ18512.1 3'-5' exonuclease [bacterium]